MPFPNAAMMNVGGSTRAWSPLDIGAHVAGYWDPRAGLTIPSSNYVSRIANQKAGQPDLLGVNNPYPTYYPTGLNGKDRISLSNGAGGNGFIMSGGTWATADTWIIAVLSSGNGSYFRWEGTISGVSRTRTLDDDLSGVWRLYDESNSTVVSAASGDPSAPHVVTIGLTSGAHILKYNGLQVVSGGGGFVLDAAQSLRISFGTPYPANGNLGPVVLLQAPTTDEIQRAEGWAAWEYGLQGNLTSGHPYKTSRPT